MTIVFLYEESKQLLLKYIFKVALEGRVLKQIKVFLQRYTFNTITKTLK